MEVLLTGNTGYLTEDFVARAFPGCHVLINGDCGFKSDKGKNITVLPAVKKGEEEKEIFEAYGFDRVIYFSQYLTFHGTYEGEMEMLRKVLQYCRSRENIQMLYLAGPEGNYSVSTGKTVMAEAGEQLCIHYSEVNHVQVKIIRIPYLYSVVYKKDYFYNLFRQIERKGRISLPESAGQKMYFLCIDDLAGLLYRVFDSWDGKNEILNAADDFGITFGDFAGVLKKWNPKAKISLLGKAVIQNLRENDKTLRQRYGWFPKISILSDFQYLAERYRETKEPEAGRWKRWKKWIQGQGKIWKSAEMLVSFCMAEILGRMLGNHVQFRMIDFRLLFIVLMGTVFGMNMGIAAAALTSVSLVAAYTGQGIGWLTLFYEPMNWIPFISYFIVGAVCGYVQLKNQDTIRFLKKDNTLLREKVSFIKSLYQDILKEKRELKKQILGSRDSFGKIFDITKQLDTVRPQEVFLTAVRIMEEVLENHTVSIYSIGNNKNFARLEIASKGILQTLPRTLKLKEYQEVVGALERNKVWVNTKMKEQFPAYVAGMQKNSELMMLIMIHKAEYSQMTLYYQNLLQILCGLIETALLRALNYQEAMYEKQHLEGINIMKESYFLNKLELYHSMQEEKKADYTLLQIDRKNMTLEEAGKILDGQIRENDILGILADGSLYLILTQTPPGDAGYAVKRLTAAGFECRIVPKSEEECL